MSVTVPLVLLSTRTLAPIKGSPPGPFTVPVILVCWADAAIVAHIKNAIIRNRYTTLIVVNRFMLSLILVLWF